MKTNIPVLIGAFVFSLAVSGSARAAVVTHPFGLNPGDVYHLAFVTSTTIDAMSPLAQTYHDHVQSAADAGLHTSGLMLNWRAIVSTADPSDRANHSVNAPVSGPVYHAADLSLISFDPYGNRRGGPTRDENGINRSGFAWTGNFVDLDTSPSGDPIFINLYMGHPYGNSGFGDIEGDFVWWTGGEVARQDHKYPIYAMSEPITVTALPEPATLAVSSCLAGFGLLVARRRRKPHDPGSRSQG